MDVDVEIFNILFQTDENDDYNAIKPRRRKKESRSKKNSALRAAGCGTKFKGSS